MSEKDEINRLRNAQIDAARIGVPMFYRDPVAVKYAELHSLAAKMAEALEALIKNKDYGCWHGEDDPASESYITCGTCVFCALEDTLSLWQDYLKGGECSEHLCFNCGEDPCRCPV